VVEYPQCVPHKGCGKVRCLIEAIRRDRIDWKLKLKRLRALIFFNKIHGWCSPRRVRRWVYKAAADLAVRHGRRIRDPCRLAAIMTKAYKQTGNSKYKRLAEKYARECRGGS